jgi:hypothetical protein
MSKNFAAKFTEREAKVANSQPMDAYRFASSIKNACKQWENKRGIKSSSFMPKFKKEKIEQNANNGVDVNNK